MTRPPLCADSSGAGDDATRAQGLRASIALWLGDLNLHELQLVDVEVMKIRRRRKDVR